MDEARALKHNYIGTEHILLGLLREEEGLAARVLKSLDITVEEVRAQVARIVGQGDEVTTGQIPFTPREKSVLELGAARGALPRPQLHRHRAHPARPRARERGGRSAHPARLRRRRREDLNEIIRMLSGPAAWAAGFRRGLWGEGKELEAARPVRAQSTKATTDGKLDPVVGRQTEIERVMQILSRRQKNNPVLIGEPGVGKTGRRRGLPAARISTNQVPELLKNKQIYTLDLAALVAGSKCRVASSRSG